MPVMMHSLMDFLYFLSILEYSLIILKRLPVIPSVYNMYNSLNGLVMFCSITKIWYS